MSDIMIPIPLGRLMSWILEENKEGAVFGIKKSFIIDPDKTHEIFDRKLETPFGPTARPHTQLTQNIVVSYVTGSHLFEFRTVQKLDGENFPVSRPCIGADDKCYNCEWSAGLYMPQALGEYVEAWFAYKVLAREPGLGSPEGLQLNMSVGYDLDGIRTEKIDCFIRGMKDTSETVIFGECRQWLFDNLDRFERMSREDMEAIPPKVCSCITLSILHRYPPQEIERIAGYLIEKKRVHTFIRYNPALLGYEYARRIMDDTGYDYVAFDDFRFKGDLQYSDAVSTLQRPQALADGKGLEFGVKITNTFPIDVKQDELPNGEMYMSGRFLCPLSMPVAGKLAEDFDEKLRISYSGGADSLNTVDIMGADIWPVTMATTMLKLGGYERLEQIGRLFAAREVAAFEGVGAVRVAGLVETVKFDKHHVKAVESLPSRRINRPVPLTGCLIAPCQEGCPIHQDIAEYLQLTGVGEFKQALEVILNRSPLPFIIGTIYVHNCTSKCTRDFYESPVDVRRAKLEATEDGFEAVMTKLKVPETSPDREATMIGGDPAGLAVAYLLARGGVKVALSEKEEKVGGVARNVVPGFRISGSAIDNDVKLVTTTGVEMVNGKEVTDIEALKKDYDHVILTVGASRQDILKLEAGDIINALDFLARLKVTEGKVELGKNMVVTGGDNTVMDTARAARRNAGVERVSLVYRRTRCYMPADEEELTMTAEDGAEFAKLLAPVKLENGVLHCKKVMLGDMDTNGCRGVVATDGTVEVPADTVIAVVGEKALGALYKNFGITLDSRRRPQVNRETLETSVGSVYVAGDDLYDSATVMEGIRNGKMATKAIIGKTLAEDLFKFSDAETIYGRKGRLSEENDHMVDSARYLSHNSYCENYVEVCPNRADIFLVVPGTKKHQIIHVDYVCNECGNCGSFCPWDSAPCLGKFTPFANEADVENSKNQGFMMLDVAVGVYRVRLQGRIMGYTAGIVNADVPDGIQGIVRTVINGYSYML